MYVSKRSLGEGYLVGTGIVLASVMLGQASQSEPEAVVWNLAWCGPVLVLVGAAFWLRELELTSNQVWTVAEFSALGLGLGTMLLVGIELLSLAAPVADAEPVLVGTTLSTMTVAGAFAGVITSLHRSKQAVRRRNAVLNRVLRHNLRNDMTVVMCLLDDIADQSNDEYATSIQQAKNKITSLVTLTDKLRQASSPHPEEALTRQKRDVTQLVTDRIEHIADAYPELTIETNLTDSAPAHVDESFGLVIDNIVESARLGATENPRLTIQVDSAGGVVTLSVIDRADLLPAADLEAVATGPETALEHGLGVELWLVNWVVKANGGDVRFEVTDDQRCITIEVERATDRWLTS
jgi:K+-sensing histidine kinase KdpD